MRRGWVPAICAAATLAAASPAPAAVTVSPEPGSIAASPATQISLRGVAPAAVGPIDVRGSHTGPHSGRLLAHSDGQGASFVPDKPFAGGERVTVRTRLDVSGTASSGFHFTIAHGALETLGQSRAVVPRGRFAQQRFHSRPDLRPPAVTVRVSRPGRTRSPILLATKRGKRDGPMILDDNGGLIWFHPQHRGHPASDLRVATWHGQPVLTWWEGRFSVGWGFGEGVVVDSSYREIARIRAGNGYQVDLHDFLLTPRGTALMTIYHRVRTPRGRVMDGIVQEVDPETGLVLYEWHALDHVLVGDSYVPRPRDRRTWDYFHINSVQAAPDGSLVISARNTHAIYSIDPATGAIRWTLGGRHSDFRMGRGTRFAWQHDARLHGDGTLTLFDNSDAPPMRKRSRALRLRLDVRRHRASLLTDLTHPRDLLSPNQGGVQDLGGGRLMVGWGANPWFTEYDAAGRIVFDAHLAAGYDSYRAYHADWVGRPAGPPAVAAERRGGRTAVWASWNGATEVASWQVLAGEDPAALAPVETAPRHGFETGISIAGAPSWVAVRALGAGGEVLRTSGAVRPG